MYTKFIKLLIVPVVIGSFLVPDTFSQQGDEWNNLKILHVNKEKLHCYFVPFESMENAFPGDEMKSVYYFSLNGIWKFDHVTKPADRPLDFYKDSYNTSAWDDIPVPGNWHFEKDEQAFLLLDEIIVK